MNTLDSSPVYYIVDNVYKFTKKCLHVCNGLTSAGSYEVDFCSHLHTYLLTLVYIKSKQKQTTINIICMMLKFK